VLGYHGCDLSVAKRVISGDAQFLQSDRDHDWLGPGAYFWEADPDRAMEYAQWKASRGEISEPTVVGAVMDLRECLDLTNREDVALLKSSYDSLVALNDRSGLPIPENRNVSSDPFANLLLRFRDCAVFRHLHKRVEEAGLAPYDTVRGMFEEGGPAFPGSAIKAKTHTQIAVRNNDCIKGVFYPLLEGALQF
jgi:hypothetical protein